MTTPHLHICVVCSGNICRSPMAAIVLTEHLRQEGLTDRVRVSSAGTGPWHVGEAADPRAMATLRESGYDGKHTAAQVDSGHLDADLLLAADSGHLRSLRTKVRDPERVRLLREFDPSAQDSARSSEPPEIPDPYYGGERGFEEVLGMIERAVPGVLYWVGERT